MEENEIVLTKDQKEAIRLMEIWFKDEKDIMFVLSGYAGTGKTFLISYFVREILNLDLMEDVKFSAPTGKAATMLMKRGVPACTLHSLIYDAKEIVSDTVLDGVAIKEKKTIFTLKKEIPNYKLIILDEVSMVNDKMMEDLLSFGTKVICLGDSFQLPPVAGDNHVIEDPDFNLEEIVRQEAGNPIIQVASMARNHEYIPYGNYGNSVIVIDKHLLSAEQRKNLFLQADQIICGLNASRFQLNAEIRSYKGIDPDREKLPLEDEKVICTLNDWDKTLAMDDGNTFPFSLVNGTIGTCKNVKTMHDNVGKFEFKADYLKDYTDCYFDSGLFLTGEYYHLPKQIVCEFTEDFMVKKKIDRRQFPDRKSFKDAVYDFTEKLLLTESEEIIDRFEFAYACSCHKLQGSEFDKVVIIDESKRFQESDRWLYTAITRAKKKLVIIR